MGNKVNNVYNSQYSAKDAMGEVSGATAVVDVTTSPPKEVEEQKISTRLRTRSVTRTKISSIPDKPPLSSDVAPIKPSSDTSDRDGIAYLGEDTLLLIICANRPDYLQKTLKYVLDYHPKSSVPILVSQDGDNPRVNDVISGAERRFQQISQLPFNHIHFSSNKGYENGYFRLADHFKFALDEAFHSERRKNIKRVIILEEDLQIAPDFYEYFAATAPLLDQENTLFAISAWNDNGFRSQVKDERRLYRSDFFPGLGWMMKRSLWEELGPKWPRAYWDDWLREPIQRKGRQVIRPEVSRTLHFGVRGVSNAQYSDYLTQIRLNDQMVPFTTLDLSYLSEDKWDTWYLKMVRDAPLVSMNEARRILANVGSLSEEAKEIGLRLKYNSLNAESREPDSYSSLARWSGAMDNVKANVPRTAYKGVVTVYKSGVKIHLVPSNFT